jgi:hypothetical protein
MPRSEPGMRPMPSHPFRGNADGGWHRFGAPPVRNTGGRPASGPVETSNGNRVPTIFLPTGSEGARSPVFTHQTANTYRERVAVARIAESRYQNSNYFLNTNYGYGYGYGYGYYPYGGFGYLGSGFLWSPYLMSYGTWCDPFNLFWQFPDPACLANYGYALNFSLYPYSFGGPFSFFGYGPSYFTASSSPCYYNSPTIFFSSYPVSPLDLTWNDTFCGPTGYGPFSYGLNGMFLTSPLLFSPYTGGSASAATSSSGNANLYVAGSAPLSSAGELFTVASPASAPRPVFHDADLSPSSAREPLTLVFSNGKKVKATGYWLDAQGQLHFVNAQGQNKTIPASQLDMKATIKENPGKGIELLSSPSASPQPHER